MEDALFQSTVQEGDGEKEQHGENEEQNEWCSGEDFQRVEESKEQGETAMNTRNTHPPDAESGSSIRCDEHVENDNNVHVSDTTNLSGENSCNGVSQDEERANQQTTDSSRKGDMLLLMQGEEPFFLKQDSSEFAGENCDKRVSQDDEGGNDVRTDSSRKEDMLVLIQNDEPFFLKQDSASSSKQGGEEGIWCDKQEDDGSNSVTPAGIHEGEPDESQYEEQDESQYAQNTNTTTRTQYVWKRMQLSRDQQDQEQEQERDNDIPEQEGQLPGHAVMDPNSKRGAMSATVEAVTGEMDEFGNEQVNAPPCPSTLNGAISRGEAYRFAGPNRRWIRFTRPGAVHMTGRAPYSGQQRRNRSMSLRRPGRRGGGRLQRRPSSGSNASEDRVEASIAEGPDQQVGAGQQVGADQQIGAEGGAVPAFLLDRNEDDGMDSNEHVVEGMDFAAWNEMQEQVQQRQHRKRLFRGALLLLTLGSSIVTVVVVVVARVAANNRQVRFVTPPWESSPPALSGPTAEPTLTPTQHYQTELFDLVLTVSSHRDLTDPDSPQFRAFQFILEENIHNEETEHSNVTTIFHRQQRVPDFKIIQRYILVVLFYALRWDHEVCDGKKHFACKASSQQLLHDVDECDWLAITCQLRQAAEESGPPSMATHGHVTVIDYIGEKRITEPVGATIPSEVGRLPELEFLVLDNLGIQGTIPPSLGESARRLQMLWLQTNFLVGPLPATMRFHPKLKIIVMTTNPTFGGTIPKMISTFSALVEFTASNCGLTGSVPTELGALKSLNILNLSRNSLKGSIPSELATIPRMQKLHLNENQLSGTLEQSFFEAWPILDAIVLHHNKLSGPVFVEEKSAHLPFTGRRTHRKVVWGSDIFVPLLVDLAYNQFSGTISQSFASIRNLGFLYLHGNELTGTIPEQVCQLFDGKHPSGDKIQSLRNLTADCARGGKNGIPGKIECSCCTMCLG